MTNMHNINVNYTVVILKTKKTEKRKFLVPKETWHKMDSFEQHRWLSSLDDSVFVKSFSPSTPTKTK